MLFLILMLVIALVFAILGLLNNSARYASISCLAIIVLLALRFGGLVK